MNHMKCVKTALAELGGSASVNTADFTLDVRIGGRHRRLYPQFLVIRDLKRAYEFDFTEEVLDFNGWYPILNKNWDISSEKLKFKALLNEHGFRTPFHAFDAKARPRDVIIKQSSSSFGDSLR